MRGPIWIAAAALLAAMACGGRLLPLSGEKDGLGTGSADASVDGSDGGDGGGDDGSLPDGGPPPIATCSGSPFMCIPPDAGVVWRPASIIKCKAVTYEGLWTLSLERMVGSTFQVVDTQSVQEPGFPPSFYDLNAPKSMTPTYRVCTVEKGSTPQCGEPFTTDPPGTCGCEGTSCWTQTACNTSLYDGCGQSLRCGACTNGTPCNPENHSCCPMGQMTDGWGGCVCGPPPTGCPRGYFWNTQLCECQSGQ